MIARLDMTVDVMPKSLDFREASLHADKISRFSPGFLKCESFNAGCELYALVR